MRGRKSKPIALKILEGTAKARDNFLEPVLPPGSTKPPAGLGEKALELWNELAPMLFEAGLLSAGDRPALKLLCKTYEAYEKDPCTSKSDSYRKLLNEFGLTPYSRSRVKSVAAKPKDKLEEFLGT